MRDYGAFRKLLEEKGLVYHFSEDAGTYEVYRIRGWEKQDPLVSIPAQVARRDIEGARNTILTALELEVMFGS